MPALLQRYRQTITTATDYPVSPGYRYSLFIGPFASGTVAVEAVSSKRVPTEYKVALTTASTTAGKIIEFAAPTDLVRITPSAATNVYVELQVINTVSNSTETYV